MKKITLIRGAMMATLLMMVCPMATHATVLRAFVSSTGNDANAATNCAQTAPCKTFAGAFPTVTAGGELIALDTSGYGPLASINKAITIAAVPGATAFVVAAAGTAAFTVNGAASDAITLRNISFNGSGAAGTTGVLHNSGKLVIQNCTFQKLTTGFSTATKTPEIIDSDFYFNGTGIHANGHGTDGQGEVSTCLVLVRGGNVVGNSVGFQSDNAGVNAMMNPLQNIWVYGPNNAVFTNMSGNTQNGACTKPMGQAQACTITPNIFSFAALLN